MERYENIVKIEEIRRLVENSQYEKAMKVLDTMDSGKIKALTDLSVIADVYTQNGRYEEAMEVLIKIYGKIKTRRVLYQLVDLSIKRGSASEAEDYLEKYIKAAPQDSSRFIFRYCIDKLKHEPYDVLIAPLEQLKEYEYYEMWAYELAKLYHKAGMKDKCVRECSDIILWFGDGIYVEKAKLLKGYYVGEINPIHMLKAKEKKEAEKKFGLDKTKDYSAMRSQIDQFIANDDTSAGQKTDMRQDSFIENENDTAAEGEDQELKEFFKKVARKLEKGVTEPIHNNVVNFVKESGEDINEKDEVSDTNAAEYNEKLNIDAEPDIILKEFLDSERKKEEEIQDFENKEEAEEIYNSENKEEAEEIHNSEDKEEAERIHNSEDKEEAEEIYNSEDKEEAEEIYNFENKYEAELINNFEVKEESEVIQNYENNDLPKEPQNFEINDEQEEMNNSEYEFKVMQPSVKYPEEHKKGSQYIPGKFDSIFSEAGMNYENDFGYFINIDSCRKQIDSCLESILSDYTKTNHMMIIGGKKTGKTTLAKKLSKALYGLNWINTNRVAKIAASKLNGISLGSKADKLAGSSLIIEEAGLLDTGAAKQLLSLIQNLNENIFVILEDNENGIKRLLKKNPELEEVFGSAIWLPEYTKEDLYGFAFTYIRNNDYEFTREVKTAFEEEIDNVIQSVKTEDQLEAVMNLAKKAKTSADERNKSLLSDIILDRDLSSEDFLYIKKEDFL